MARDPVIDDLRRRIASDEAPARIREQIRSLILERIDSADPLSDRTKNHLVSAIAALDTASRRKGVELGRSRLSSALLHLQLSRSDHVPSRSPQGRPAEILEALTRDMLRDAARRIAW